MADPVEPENNSTPENAEHKKRMQELFGDIDDDMDSEETIESLREERNDLLKQVGDLSTALSNAQGDNLTLYRKNEDLKASFARAEAKFEQDRKYALEKFIKEVLPVVDVLEMGLNAVSVKDRETDPKYAKLADGFEKTVKQLTAVFNKFGIREIEAMGQEFNPAKHEAVTTQEKDGVDPETVIHVVQKGFEIEGRVIRPARVVITPA